MNLIIEVEVKKESKILMRVIVIRLILVRVLVMVQEILVNLNHQMLTTSGLGIRQMNICSVLRLAITYNPS